MTKAHKSHKNHKQPRLNLSIDNGYFFIVSVSLFIFNVVFITTLLAQSFKNTVDLFSYFFTVAGLLLVIKTFIVSYANFTYSIREKRFYVLIANCVVMAFEYMCFFLALIWFQNETYPQTIMVYYLLASCGLIAQLVLGKLASSIKYQVTALVYYTILLILLYTQVFNADVRYLQVISLGNIILELLLLLNIYRIFQTKEIIQLQALTS